mgnify:CR=1 FL=1
MDLTGSMLGSEPVELELPVVVEQSMSDSVLLELSLWTYSGHLLEGDYSKRTRHLRLGGAIWSCHNREPRRRN